MNGEADEAYLQRLFNELSRAPKQLMILMKYVELSGWVTKGLSLIHISSFGDDTVYLEKFVEEPHHIEFQILGDNHRCV